MSPTLSQLNPVDPTNTMNRFTPPLMSEDDGNSAVATVEDREEAKSNEDVDVGVQPAMS
jgi:hypothetical protein